MLKEFILKIEDKESPDFNKTFKIKQPAVLEFEKLLVKFAGCFTANSGINEDKTIELLNEILKYCYYISKDTKTNTEIEIQLVNDRANEIIEDPYTLLLLKKEFIEKNSAFTKVVGFVKQQLGAIKNTTTTK